MISLIFVLLSAIFDSVKDHCSHHWQGSRLQRWVSKLTDYPDKWWYQSTSWKNKYDGWWWQKLIVQISDADHFFKTLRIIAWLVAIVLYEPIIQIWVIPVMITDFLILGISRNIVFSIFYKLWR